MGSRFFSGFNDLHLFPRGVHVDSLTVVPEDLYWEFAMAGERARKRGHHCVENRRVRDLPPQQHLVRTTRDEEDLNDKSSFNLLSRNSFSLLCSDAAQKACTLKKKLIGMVDRSIASGESVFCELAS